MQRKHWSDGHAKCPLSNGVSVFVYDLSTGWQNLAGRLAGVFGALATLTHFIAIPTVLSLGLVLLWQRRGQALLAFVSLLILGWLLWLSYATQDWQSWLGQLSMQFARKGEKGILLLALQILFLQSLLPIFGVFPINALPLWFALVVASILSIWRKNSPLTGWQTACLVIPYFSSAVGGELWYIGWWTPFGYLLLSLWLSKTFEKLSRKFWLLAICLLWTGWQLLGIGQAATGAHICKRSIDKFFAEIQIAIPKGALVLLHCVPDPFQTLQENRPDLCLIQISPTPMSPRALKRVLSNADFFVGLREWVESRGIVNLAKAEKTWLFRTTLKTWSVGLYRLKKEKF